MEAFSRQRLRCSWRAPAPAGEQASLSAGLQQQQEGISGRHCPPGRLPGTQEKVWFYKGRCQSQDVHVCETRNKHQAQPKLIRGEHLLRVVHTILRQAGDRDTRGKGRPGGRGAARPLPNADLRQDTSSFEASVSLSAKWG